MCTDGGATTTTRVSVGRIVIVGVCRLVVIRESIITHTRAFCARALGRDTRDARDGVASQSC
jgi:hypothetical protein